MDDLSYFDIEGPVSEEVQAFLAALRDRIDGRIFPTCFREDPADGDALMVVIDISADRAVLLTVGVRIWNGRLHGDRVHNQQYEFPKQSSAMAIDSEGTPSDLAAVAAAWFDALLRRPIVRREWLHRGRVYAHCYAFADTGEGLVQGYRQDP